MKETKGDLIVMAKEGRFDVFGHGCNCFCTMGKGIAPQIKKAFPEMWAADTVTESGDFNKMGNYTYADMVVYDNDDQPKVITGINIYSQYKYNRRGQNDVHLDYTALTLALRKINFNYKGKTIGLPLIGAGLGGGDWSLIRQIIETELKDMDIIIVHYEK